MNMKLLAAAAVAALSMGLSANAAVTTVGNQAAFNAAGTITQNTNWDSYGPSFSFPGNNFVVGDLTFVAGAENLIGEAGPGGVYNTGRNLLTDNFVRGTTIQIAGLHDLFAFNLGNFFNTGAANISVTTNLGNYNFSPVVTTAVNSGGVFTFAGYQASAGEYFTSVNYSGGGATGATDIQLGSAGAVPEPATWAMMIIGFGAAGSMIRRRKVVIA